MKARKVFLKPEIQSYNQATLNLLVGPIITQYGPPANSPPQLTSFTCSPEVPFNNECPETLPRIQVTFDWQKIVGDMVGGEEMLYLHLSGEKRPGWCLADLRPFDRSELC